MASSAIEKPRTHGPGSGLGGNWLVIVRNDSHNTFEHVARTLSRCIPGIDYSKGMAFANQIHRQRSGDRLVRAEGAGRALLGAVGFSGLDDGPAGGSLSRRDPTTA